MVGREYQLICSYICEKHEHRKQEHVESLCRGRCQSCGLRKVHGYTNPDHTCNPFGYLYLIPKICHACALRAEQCMWCVPNKVQREK